MKNSITDLLDDFVRVKDEVEVAGQETQIFKDLQHSIYCSVQHINEIHACDQKSYMIDREINVVEYAPDVFARLRAWDHYDNTSLSDSLDPTIEANVHKIFKAGEGMGKSGSFFFFSHDDRFLIKSMTLDDFQSFMKLFPYYFDHMSYYEDSLIARIYGIYRVDMDEMAPVYLLLMGNTKRIDNSYVKKIYDLKGSLDKRVVKGNEASFKNTECLKDINILNLKEKEVLVKFSPKQRRHIMTKIAQGVGLLSQFNLMDYSLLFCVSFNPRYIEMYPDKFVREADGELVKPYELVKKEKIKDNSYRAEVKEQVANEFMDLMTGLEPAQLHDYANQYAQSTAALPFLRSVDAADVCFDYAYMQEPPAHL